MSQPPNWGEMQVVTHTDVDSNRYKDRQIDTHQ